MLTRIVHFSLRFRGVIIALACVLIGFGLYSLSHARYDVFPEFAPPQVSIRTEAPRCEIEGPMAMVILGGLATSTALNLLVLPTLALRFGRFGEKEEWERT